MCRAARITAEECHVVVFWVRTYYTYNNIYLYCRTSNEITTDSLRVGKRNVAAAHLTLVRLEETRRRVKVLSPMDVTPIRIIKRAEPCSLERSNESVSASLPIPFIRMLHILVCCTYLSTITIINL